jgi:[acyl-carrier-protein] S-malonyltransferase
LDTRVRELRASHLAARLPAPGSKEDRQFLRWTAQVLLTEELCRLELARLARLAGVTRLAGESAGEVALAAPLAAAESELAASISADGDAGWVTEADGLAVGVAKPRVLSQAESLYLGSINAAAWSNSPAMSALFDLVTAPAPPAAPAADARAWYRVTHAVAGSAGEAASLREQSLGWTTLDDLPAHLAAELRAVPPGTRVGPIRSGLGWHVATVVAAEVRAGQPASATSAVDPGRLAAFNRWLDLRRQALVVHAPGFEHPGDPSQPDNTHRH